MLNVKQYLRPALDHDTLMQKDRWHIDEMGITPSPSEKVYTISFSRINQSWLKFAAKQFIRLQSSTKSFSSCLSYMTMFSHLSKFLSTFENSYDPQVVNRQFVIRFMSYLCQKNLGAVSRKTQLIHLRTFHNTCMHENWLPWPERPIVFPDDLPKEAKPIPKFIPKEVMKQLYQHLHDLKPYLRHAIIVLIETGRRASEVLTLKTDCLELDNQGDYYLRVYEKKMSRIRLLPISNTCVSTIKRQISYLKDKKYANGYLFPCTRPVIYGTHSPCMGRGYLNKMLNELAQQHCIKNYNGQVWHFTCHQFRHTVGTDMINSGVPQIMVQEYLGHKSPGMTARYAHIHNQTLKKAYIDFQKRIVDIHGEEKALEAQWLKDNIASQVLPNGLCSLPLTQTKCPHANACLTCANFRTSREHLKQHKQQLRKTNDVISQARKNHWPRIIEMNESVSESLQSIITTLEKHDD